MPGGFVGEGSGGNVGPIAMTICGDVSRGGTPTELAILSAGRQRFQITSVRCETQGATVAQAHWTFFPSAKMMKNGR